MDEKLHANFFIRNIAQRTCAFSSFSVKYQCPDTGWVKLEISPLAKFGKNYPPTSDVRQNLVERRNKYCLTYYSINAQPSSTQLQIESNSKSIEVSGSSVLLAKSDKNAQSKLSPSDKRFNTSLSIILSSSNHSPFA